jgi:hypothetical protein
MDFGFLGAASEAPAAVKVILISGTCCNPTLGSLDEKAKRIVEAAAKELGIAAEVETITMTSAYYAAPQEVRRKLMADFSSGRLAVPAVLIAGKAISYGIPSAEAVKAALLEASRAESSDRERT